MTMRIACWSGPRNLSTALMRAWENRPDTLVVDEPLYAYYLRVTGKHHPMRERVLESQSTQWREVARQLTGPLPGDPAIHYQKHMAHHLLDEVERDWMKWLTHVFLIRDPAAVVASYARARGELTLDDLGYRQLLELYVWVRDELGQDPPIVDRTRLLRDPRAQLERLCAQLGVPFDERMLSWPAGPRETDGVWAEHWYEKVRRSTGFEELDLREPDVPHGLRRVDQRAQPLYEELLGRAIELA